ncbi:MAG: 30S ribosomal protein S13 [Candidatus Campbellbacteria bacterium]|nr:30S ribosomal protein S13 [Candidatus Campbellbacteria bacterium]
MRIAGITIPEKTHLEIGLTTIYGVGRVSARRILKEANIKEHTTPENLTEAQDQAIRKSIESLKIEGDLRREVSSNIKRKKDIGSYQGKRHMVRLPVRGQRTKTNARTRKGAVKTMGSGRVKLQKK